MRLTGRILRALKTTEVTPEALRSWIGVFRIATNEQIMLTTRKTTEMIRAIL